MADELLRFIQLRGAVPARPDDNLVISAWTDPPSQLEDQLVAAAEAGEDPRAVARQWLSQNGNEGLISLLRRLNSEAIGSFDEVTVQSLRRDVLHFLDTAETLDRARAQAQDLLLATSLLSDLPVADRSTAHRLVILAVAGQKALGWGVEDQDANGHSGDDGESRRNDQALRDLLIRGAAALPVRVSALLGPSTEPKQELRALDAKAPEVAVDGHEAEAGVAGGGPNEWQLREAALAELVSIVISPGADPEVVPAVAEAPEDDAPARLRPLTETRTPQARVRLQDAVLERLSDSTRALLEVAAPGETDLLNAISALERADLSTRPPALSPAAQPIDPTGGFPAGYGALRPPEQGLVRPPGVGELLRVRREHDRYVLGPITYIENVLAGETRKRTHRRLDRTEDTTFFETERTVVDERDLQSSERFDMVVETNNEVNSQTQLQVGAQVSGSYGTVQASASFGYTSSSASKESSRTATETARETVDRVVKRITERTLERRQRTTIREVEETNRHALTNNDPKSNRAGIYRFVDDEQTVGVYSYGLRLMFEAHVPEPGAYLRWSTRAVVDNSEDPEPPKPTVAPGVLLTSPAQLFESNYQEVAGRYAAAVEPAPSLFSVIATSGRQEYNQNTPDAATPAFLFYRSENRLEVPDGYQAVRAMGVMQASAWNFDVYIAVGAAAFRDTTTPGAAMPLVFDLLLANETATVPYVFTIHNAWGFAYTMEIVCLRTNGALEKWQNQAFNAIMQAYSERYSAWRERRRAASISVAGVVTGTNPEINRQVERTELKKAVISLLSGSPLKNFGAVTQATSDDEPELDDLAAVGQSAVISFLEQAFEWEQTIYSLYPYFWGRHSSWPNANTGDGSDPVHDAFLEAGLARTVVPVRPGFEQVALWYFATGQVWKGGSPPPISTIDPLYVSLATELLAADTAARGGVLVDETWQVTTPTNLVYLQEDSELNPPN